MHRSKRSKARRSIRKRSTRKRQSTRRSNQNRNARYFGLAGDGCRPLSSVNVLEAAYKKNLTKVPNQFLTKIDCYANCPSRTNSYQQVDEQAKDPVFKNNVMWRRRCLNKVGPKDLFLVAKKFSRDVSTPISDEIEDMFDEMDTDAKRKAFNEKKQQEHVKGIEWTSK